MTVKSAKTKVAGQVVRTELLQRGWQVKDLALRLGVSNRHVSNVLSGTIQSQCLELQIEDLLGRALWSTAEEFSARQIDRGRTRSAAGEQNKKLE